jgi:hypothetical protein
MRSLWPPAILIGAGDLEKVMHHFCFYENPSFNVGAARVTAVTLRSDLLV